MNSYEAQATRKSGECACLTRHDVGFINPQLKIQIIVTIISNMIFALKDFLSAEKRFLTNVEEYKLTPWLMEPGGSIPHSQGLFNIPYPESDQASSS